MLITGWKQFLGGLVFMHHRIFTIMPNDNGCSRLMRDRSSRTLNRFIFGLAWRCRRCTAPFSFTRTATYFWNGLSAVQLPAGFFSSGSSLSVKNLFISFPIACLSSESFYLLIPAGQNYKTPLLSFEQNWSEFLRSQKWLIFHPCYFLTWRT